MTKRRVLISGAGIAGPALAKALGPSGYETTVVERATALREGGQAVDFRGPVHREVLERMGLWEPIHEHRTRGTDLVMLGRGGKNICTLPAVMMSGDVEILRGDLTRLLYDRTRSFATYRFGDSATALDEKPDGVTVTFASGRVETFNLVIGADGLHSRIRTLAFGPESSFLRHHGYRLATFSLPNVLGLRQNAFTYTVPGRAMTVQAEGTERMRATFIFCGAPLDESERDGDGARRMLHEAYADIGWEVPRVLAEVENANDLYVDQVGTIHVDRYANGRVVLLGDAAYGGTLGGQGTSLAIVEVRTCSRASSPPQGPITRPPSPATKSECGPTPRRARRAPSASAPSSRRAPASACSCATCSTRRSRHDCSSVSSRRW